MSPRDLSNAMANDDRLFNGRFFSSNPIDIGSGDCVGVVLLVPGAPESQEDVYPYLYRRLMQPGGKKSGLRSWLSHLKSRFSARLLTREVIKDYREIGGGASINRLNREQALDLGRRLKSSVIIPEGVHIKTYLVSPFGSPSMLDAAEKMKQEGVTHVVLLPLFPQYGIETTGRALAHWEALIKNHEIAARPTTAIWEFASNDKYVEALNERIDQGLQRFPRKARPDVTILFAAHGTFVGDSKDNKDPYCCLVHHTVDRLMQKRNHDHAFKLSFVRDGGWGTSISIDLKNQFSDLARAGKRAVLVVPVDYVTEQFDTAYMLDVKARTEAEASGIAYYHVAAGLNCHPLFIEGLTDLVVESIVPSSKKPEMLCVEACPRTGWHGKDEPEGDKCSVCPFLSNPKENKTARPSQRHGSLSTASTRDPVSRKG